jgi:hypothetical protein
MKTNLLVLLGMTLIIIVISCKRKENGTDSLVGNWGYGRDSIVTFQKHDTTVLGILIHNIKDYSQEESVEYPGGSVLFKDIKKLSDSTFVAKGLHIKAIYNKYMVKKPTIVNWGGDDGHGNVFVEEKQFDHFEKTYVDYRLEITDHFQPIKNVFCKRLKCIPFIDGTKWDFLSGLSEQGKKAFVTEEIRVADSIRIADSMEQARVENERRKVKEAEKNTRAQELLK